MAKATVDDVAKVLWEARIREAWGTHADIIVSRTPWPLHEAHPLRAASHELAYAEARAIMKQFNLEAK